MGSSQDIDTFNQWCLCRILQMWLMKK